MQPMMIPGQVQNHTFVETQYFKHLRFQHHRLQFIYVCYVTLYSSHTQNEGKMIANSRDFVLQIDIYFILKY